MTALPEDALDREVLVRMTVREQGEWLAWKYGSIRRPVDTATAAEILDLPERTVRSLATRWLKMQAMGKRPPVRVSRTSGAANAHWRLDRDELEAYAGSDEQEGPRLHTESRTDPNDPAAIAADYLARNG